MKACTYCGTPAFLRCRKHRRYVCRNANCAGLHRLSIRPDLCEMVDLNSPISGWRMHVLRTAVALAVGLLVVGFLAL